MSDGAFRDDHEAALARIGALERELADTQRDDRANADRAAALEDKLAKVRRERDELRDQRDCSALPAAPLRVATATARQTPQVRGTTLLLASVPGVLVLLILFIWAAAEPHSQSESTRGSHQRVQAAEGLVACIGQARTLRSDDLAEPTMRSGYDDSTCLRVLDVAGNDHRFAPFVRSKLRTLAYRFRMLDEVVAKLPVVAPPNPELRRELDQAVAFLIDHAEAMNDDLPTLRAIAAP